MTSQTPQIKSVKEVLQSVYSPDVSPDDMIMQAITQDRAAIHASLVAAVEGVKYQQPHVDTPFHTEDKVYAMNATLDQVLTIINNIFKE